MATVLVTGGYGCIGAETAKYLIRDTDCRVVVASRSVHAERSQRVFGDTDSDRLTFVKVDVTDQHRLEQVIAEHEVTRVAHLAGLQTPDCNQHRDLGLQVNLAGTQNIIEAMKQVPQQIERFVYASSIAVYGPRAHYPEGLIPMSAEPMPVNVYGVWKMASEHVCRLYASEYDVDTISIRPGVLFGPGRDQGLTSTTTTAMKHVALGSDYQIPFQNRQDYLYAPDVGAAFGHALLQPFSGYAGFTLPSHCVDTAAMVQAMEQAHQQLGLESPFGITVGDDEVPFVCELEYQPFLDAFPQAPHTPLDEAVRRSIEVFVEQKKDGVLQL